MSSSTSTKNVVSNTAELAEDDSWSRKPYVSLYFSQQADVVKLPNTVVSSQATFEVWINPTKSTPLGYIIFKKSTFAIALQDQELVVAFGNVQPGWKWIHSDWRAPFNEWSHVIVTYDDEAGVSSTYINGKLQKSSVIKGALPVLDNPLQICIKSFKKTGPIKTRYTGRVADVRVWNQAHSTERIARNWAKPLNGNEPGLLGYWAFDEGAGNRLMDRSLHARHGELHGPTWHMSVSIPESSLQASMRKVLNSALGSDVRLRAGRDGKFRLPTDNAASVDFEIFYRNLTKRPQAA